MKAALIPDYPVRHTHSLFRPYCFWQALYQEKCALDQLCIMWDGKHFLIVQNYEMALCLWLCSHCENDLMTKVDCRLGEYMWGKKMHIFRLNLGREY